MNKVRVKKLCRILSMVGIIIFALGGQTFAVQSIADDYFPVQLYLPDQERPYLLVLPYNSLPADIKTMLGKQFQIHPDSHTLLIDKNRVWSNGESLKDVIQTLGDGDMIIRVQKKDKKVSKETEEKRQ